MPEVPNRYSGRHTHNKYMPQPLWFNSRSTAFILGAQIYLQLLHSLQSFSHIIFRA